MKHYVLLFFLMGFPLGLYADSYGADAQRFLLAVYDKHPDILSARLRLSEQQLGVTEAEALYDPVITGRLSRQKDAATYVSQTGQIVSKETTTLEAGVSQQLPHGGALELGMQTIQQDNSGRLYSSRLALDFRQPLLKGFGTLPTEYGLYSSQSTAAQAKQDYDMVVASALQEALISYGDYIIAIQKKALYDDDIALYTYLMSQIQRKQELNLSDNVAVLDAEIQLSTAQDAQQDAQNTVTTLEHTLKRLIQEVWVPTPSGTTTVPEPLPVADAIVYASTHNPELRKYAEQVAYHTLALRYQDNQRLPTLDLTSSLGYSKYGEQWEESFNFQEPSFVVGLSTRLPWGNKEAEAHYQSARLALERLSHDKQDKERQLQHSIESAYREVALKEARVSSAQKRLALAIQKRDVARKKFELGLSVIDTLLEAQTYKTDMAIEALSAEMAYIQACLTRDSLTGNLGSWIPALN